MESAARDDQAFALLERVIADPLRFKAKLGIGEDAYASLRRVRKAREYWDLAGAAGGGAAIAKMLAIGAGATPLGWIVAAALASGGAWYGLQKALAGATSSRVDVIPKLINTPIDALGVSLFDLLAPLALKVAAPERAPRAAEIDRIRGHFVGEWGFDAPFVDAGLGHLTARLDGIALDDVAQRLAAFLRANPDCNEAAMSRDIVAFLHEVATTEAANAALARIEGALVATGDAGFGKSLREAAAASGEGLRRGAVAIGAAARDVGQRALPVVREAADRAVPIARDAAERAAPVVRDAAVATARGVGKLAEQVAATTTAAIAERYRKARDKGRSKG